MVSIGGNCIPEEQKGIGFLHVTTWELELVARSSSSTILELFTPLPWSL